MEITSRQRARLKGIASNYDTIFQIGKNSILQFLVFDLPLAEGFHQLGYGIVNGINLFFSS